MSLLKHWGMNSNPTDVFWLHVNLPVTTSHIKRKKYVEPGPENGIHLSSYYH